MSAPGLHTCLISASLHSTSVPSVPLCFLQPRKNQKSSHQCLAELRHRLSSLLARVSPPFHYGETLRSLLFPSLQSPPPLSIPAKIKKPMKHPVRNKINLSKNHTNIINNFSKNTQKHKIISTEKVPRIPHIYIQNSYELLAGLTNL